MGASFGFALVDQDKKEGEIKRKQAGRRKHHRPAEGMLASCKRCSLSMRTRATHERSQTPASKDKDKEKYNGRQQAAPASPRGQLECD
jgi:hypothetical protein